MPCVHIDKLKHLQPPKLSQSVHREECTQCFDNQVSFFSIATSDLTYERYQGQSGRNRRLLRLLQWWLLGQHKASCFDSCTKIGSPIYVECEKETETEHFWSSMARLYDFLKLY